MITLRLLVIFVVSRLTLSSSLYENIFEGSLVRLTTDLFTGTIDFPTEIRYTLCPNLDSNLKSQITNETVTVVENIRDSFAHIRKKRIVPEEPPWNPTYTHTDKIAVQESDTLINFCDPDIWTITLDWIYLKKKILAPTVLSSSFDINIHYTDSSNGKLSSSLFSIKIQVDIANPLTLPPLIGINGGHYYYASLPGVNLLPMTIYNESCPTGSFVNGLSLKTNSLTVNFLRLLHSMKMSCSDGSLLPISNSNSYPYQSSEQDLNECSATGNLPASALQVDISSFDTMRIPISLKLNCANNNKTYWVITGRDESSVTHDCNPGSLVSGFLVFSGDAVQGISPICTPVTLNVSLAPAITVNFSQGSTKFILNHSIISSSSIGFGNVRDMLFLEFTNISYPLRLELFLQGKWSTVSKVSYRQLLDNQVRLAVDAENLNNLGGISDSLLAITLTTALKHEIKGKSIRLLINVISPSPSLLPSSGESTALTSTTELGMSSIQTIGIALGVSIPLLMAISGLICMYRRRKPLPELIQPPNNTPAVQAIKIEPNTKQADATKNDMDDNLRPKLSSSSNTSSINTTINKTAVVNNAVFLPGYLQINLDEDVSIKNLNKIHGVGSTGKIVRGRFKSQEFLTKHGDVELAVKLFYQPKKGDTAEHVAAHDIDFNFEVALMAALPKSVNLVQLLGYCDKPRAIAMKFYQECLENMLWTKIKWFSLVPFTPLQVLQIGLDIAMGLRELHKSSMVHYDIKPLNVLAERLPDKSWRFAICDFGYANVIGKERPIVKGIKPRKALGLTYNYAAPELLQRLNEKIRKSRNEMEKKIDVYAFSMTMYEVITLKCPWEGMYLPEIEKEVMIGRRPIFPSWIMADRKIMSQLGPFIELLRKCWDSSAHNRPEFDTITKIIETELKRLSSLSK